MQLLFDFMEAGLQLRDYLESQKRFWTLIVKDCGDLQNFTRAFCIMIWPQGYRGQGAELGGLNEMSPAPLPTSLRRLTPLSLTAGALWEVGSCGLVTEGGL